MGGQVRLQMIKEEEQPLQRKRQEPVESLEEQDAEQ